MQLVKKCCNYIYDHTKPIFLASASLFAGVALKAYMTPQGRYHATYRSTIRSTPQVFLGLAAIFASLAATSGRNLSKIKRSLIVLIPTLGTAVVLPTHLRNLRINREIAERLKQCTKNLIASGDLTPLAGDRLMSCGCGPCRVMWEDYAIGDSGIISKEIDNLVHSTVILPSY